MIPDQLDRVLGHGLFRNLAQERLRPFLGPLTVRAYAAGEPVAEPTLRRSALHLLLAGRLQISDVTCGGRRIILDYVEPGGVDGLLAVTGLREHFTEAVAPSEVVTIVRSLLEDMLAAEPRLAVNLLWVTSRRLRRREDHLFRLTMRDPSQRLAGQLLALIGAMDGQAAAAVRTPRLSHEALADLLGLRRETVTLHLTRLRRMGALRVDRDAFCLNVPLLLAVRDGSAAPDQRGPALRHRV